MVQPNAPVVLPHLKLSWGGGIGVPKVEVWSNALNFNVFPDEPSSAELENAAQACAAPLTAWIQNPAARIGTACYLQWVKAVWVKADGKQRDLNTALYEIPTNDQRSGVMSPNPIWEQTYAITLRTELSRGPGHAGRIFPPLSGPLPENNTSPYAAVTVIDGMTTAFGQMIQGVLSALQGTMNGGVGGPRNIYPVVVSRRTATNPTPKLTTITRAVMDRVADIQHRRVNRVERNEGAEVTIVSDPDF